MALFGEKYGDKVRVVTVHPESTELCGGTHVRRSGDIGLFKITQESSIASGVRRIVGLTGAAAIAYTREKEHQLEAAAAMFKSPTAELPKRIESAQKRVKELEKKVEEFQLKASGGAAKSAENIHDVNGTKVLTLQVDEADANLLKQLADRYRDQLKSGVVGLGGKTADGRGAHPRRRDQRPRREGLQGRRRGALMAAEVGGKGGGKPDMAQAGGPDASKIPQALEKLLQHVRS